MIGETHFGYFECENLKKYDEVAKKWKLIDEILKKFKKKYAHLMPECELDEY